MTELYPGWRMRIYHNVTLDDQPDVWAKVARVTSIIRQHLLP